MRRALGFALVGALALIAGELGARAALQNLAEDARTTASLHAAVLQTDLARVKALPYVLSQDEAVQAALRDPRLAHIVDLRLENLANQTGLGVLYILDLKAWGVAMSNWRGPRAFCRGEIVGGISCATRAYFTEAVSTGRGELFALGRADKHPGLYLSRAIDDQGTRLGVAVAKVQFDTLETHWAEVGSPTYVTDPTGVILISSIPEWRIRATHPLDPATSKRFLSSGQFGDVPLQTIRVKRRAHASKNFDIVSLSIPRRPDGAFVEVTAPVPGSDWTLHTLKAADGPTAAARFLIGGLTLLAGVVTLMGASIWRHRRARRLSEAQRALAAREELERRVDERTRALSDANLRLRGEMDERQRVEGEMLRLQDELFQANKLATLGQVVAGVAHEINQPLGAIRAYADNAVVHIDKGAGEKARANMEVVGQLTERIAAITGELRDFARRSKGRRAQVRIGDVIEGALLLVNHRAREASVEIIRIGDEDARVRAERFRLEQVLVNLLQNSLDALDGRDDAQILIRIELSAKEAAVAIADNGPGFSEDGQRSLFMPFATTKPAGLGLGLVISRDIMRSLGGDLLPISTEAGATLRLIVPRG